MALWASTRATRQLQPATACSAACRVPARLVVESSLRHLPHSSLTAPSHSPHRVEKHEVSRRSCSIGSRDSHENESGLRGMLCSCSGCEVVRGEGQHSSCEPGCPSASKPAPRSSEHLGGSIRKSLHTQTMRIALMPGSQEPVEHTCAGERAQGDAPRLRTRRRARRRSLWLKQRGQHKVRSTRRSSI